MNSKQVKSNAVLVFAAALCAMSGQASADPTLPALSPAPSVTIHLSDLNLASPEGVRIAYARIRTAAQTVCGPSFSLWDSGRWISWRQCYRETIEATVKRLDRPTLTALHQVMATKASS